MVTIWLIYLQLFWRNYRRQLRANIISNRGAGTGLDARCIIANMSAEAIFIEGIILVLERGGQRWSTAITKAKGLRQNADPAGSVPMHEGPLAAGDHVDIGRFEDLVERSFEEVEGDSEADRLGLDSFEIWVIASYTAERRLVFARRRFSVDWHRTHWALQAEKLKTETIRRGPKRRRIEAVLQEHLD